MAIATTFVVSFVRQELGAHTGSAAHGVRDRRADGVTVAMAVAAAGLIIGGLFLSGIGMKFSYILMTLSGVSSGWR